MWLLTTDRAELKWFTRPPAKYAILSHVWETNPEEQTFQEVLEIIRRCKESGENPRAQVSLKIRNCCVWAEAHGFKYVWIDTCCINKASSAELSEAINSMFAWYAEATACYAFLHDVTDGEPPDAPGSTFRESEWFTRGWTLQELIAPKVVIFLSQTWIPIASKRSISGLLEEITGIDASVLLGRITLDEVSVARRMSWAAARHTRRVEDQAYCLMGIFGVHIPTIYGEGKEAFLRLQEEIMRRIPDTTLFAWGPRGDPVETIMGYRSVFPTSQGKRYIENSCLLASSPAAFAGCSDLVSVSKKVFAAAFEVSPHNPRFTVTSHGIQANCPVIEFSSGCTLLLLPCCRTQDDSNAFLALVLRFQSENSPWCAGTRMLEEAVSVEVERLSSVVGEADSSFREEWFAQRTVVRKKMSHRDVRCVLLPIGFDFATCQQRPLKRQEPPLTPRWERNYIAYRPQQVLSKNIESRGLLGMQRRPSRSPYYKLFFPAWVVSRLERRGFVVPLFGEDPAPGLSVGERLHISFFNLQEREQMRVVLRADLASHSPSGPSLAALWCSVLLPSKVTPPSRSLDAQVSSLHEEWESSSSTQDGSIYEGSVHGGSVNGTSQASAADYTDSSIVMEDGFVDLWEHAGHKGRKEFLDGPWHLLLTFTRLCDSSGSNEDTDLCNVYLVDVDLQYLAQAI